MEARAKNSKLARLVSERQGPGENPGKNHGWNYR